MDEAKQNRGRVAAALMRWTEGTAEDWPEYGIMFEARWANPVAADERINQRSIQQARKGRP